LHSVDFFKDIEFAKIATSLKTKPTLKMNQGWEKNCYEKEN